MKTSEQKLVQYLDEAEATELALVRVLQSQIAMTPRGRLRDGLERHLAETQDHAERVNARLRELGRNGDPFAAAVGAFETLAGQALALSKTPLDLLRGTSGEEKVLKNAKDDCATEALEIATYTSIERLARSVGDETTARLAASIRADEERMLERLLTEIPRLTDAVVGAELHGDGSYDVTTTGAADAVRETGEKAARTTRRTTTRATTRTKRTARQARRVPGVARAEGRAKGALASSEDLPIARYDALKADEVVGKLPELSQVDLGKVEAYERKHEARATVLRRIEALKGNEPWPGYDELTADEVRSVLAEGDEDRAREAREYERAHKNRAGVLGAAEREAAKA